MILHMRRHLPQLSLLCSDCSTRRNGQQNGGMLIYKERYQHTVSFKILGCKGHKAVDKNQKIRSARNWLGDCTANNLIPWLQCLVTTAQSPAPAQDGSTQIRDFLGLIVQWEEVTVVVMLFIFIYVRVAVVYSTAKNVKVLQEKVICQVMLQMRCTVSGDQL